jgi:hypothetical protein
VDRLELVEIIENQKAKLSPIGKELWDELDILVYMSPEEENILQSRQVQKQQEDIAERMSYLPPYDQGVIRVLTEVRAGLYESDKESDAGASGEGRRIQAVLRAATIKDIAEGRQADPDITFEQAIARLRE